ncbi:MAG: S8 family peptidase [Saprospiraceae bacterium]
MMLNRIGGLLLFFYLLPFVMVAQLQKTELEYAQHFVDVSFQQQATLGIKPTIHYWPGHPFYLAKAKQGHPSPYLPGKIARTLDHGYVIISFTGETPNGLENLALLVPANNDWKLSPNLWQKKQEKEKGKRTFLIKVDDLSTFKRHLNQKKIAIIRAFEEISSLLIVLDFQTLQEEILPMPSVTFIDRRDVFPTEERAVRGLDLSVNKVNVLHHNYPDLNGENMQVSIKENSFDSTDIDVRGRQLASTLRGETVSTHSTTMATMIAGGGNSFYTGKGVAWKAMLSSSSFYNIMPDADSYFESENIWVQNHSYGLGIENYYGGEAMAYDDQVYRHPQLLHIFSAGNNGDGTSAAGPYQGVNGFANLTGNMKMAKNLFTVGSIDTALSIPALSSRGPAFDGRIKPEIVAFGEDGSSGAAAITSGTMLLLQQAYQQQFGERPPAGLIRAVVLNSADDIGPQGPDYLSGFGNLDALGAVQTLKEQRFFQGVVKSGEEQVFPLEIPENAINLKVTLAWIDPPALLNSNTALVNDLDLVLKDRLSNDVWLPWSLSYASDLDSLSLPAIRKRDRRNNQEQVTIDQPGITLFDITINGFDIAAGEQAFFVAYEWDTPERFDWVFPQSEDPVPAGTRIPLRWDSTSKGQGDLAYRWVGSNEWQQLSPQTALSKPYLFWNVPDTFALAQLKMTTTAGTFLTDTFVVSKPLNLSLAVDCDDRILLNWPKMPEVTSYQLFGMASNYLESLKTINDTFVVLDKSSYPAEEFAIAPIHQDGFLGVKSPAINLDYQSVGCYINSFLADLIADRVEMTLFLGTLYEVEEVIFEKRSEGQFQAISTIRPSSDLVFTANDLKLREGSNTYRAVVKLHNGNAFYSNEVTLLYTNKAYLVFPNPTTTGIGANIVSKEVNRANFLLFDNLGRLHLQFEIQNAYEEIPAEKLAPGIYHYQILLEKQRLAQGKLLIL